MFPSTSNIQVIRMIVGPPEFSARKSLDVEKESITDPKIDHSSQMLTDFLGVWSDSFSWVVITGIVMELENHMSQKMRMLSSFLCFRFLSCRTNIIVFHLRRGFPIAGSVFIGRNMQNTTVYKQHIPIVSSRGTYLIGIKKWL